MFYFDFDSSWSAIDTRVVLPIALALVFFILYWFLAGSVKIKSYYLKRYENDLALTKHMFFTKLVGFISMGVIPIIICLALIPALSLSDYGLSFISETSLFTLVWVVALSLVMILLAYVSAKNLNCFFRSPCNRLDKLFNSFKV